MPRDELARFLRDRRGGLRPADVGLPSTGRRRTPGLRREEVAGLAAMSVDYYARLEQARGPRPSPRILDALAGALRLCEAERRHLFRLADTVLTAQTAASTVRPHVVDLLRRIPEAGAVVTDATYEIVAWNPLAEALLGDLMQEPNLARRRFLHPDLHQSSAAEEFGEIAVARLRSSAARYPGDRRLRELLADLNASAEFRHIWTTNPVRTPGHRSKTFEHARGPIKVNCDVLHLPDDDQQVVLMTADPGSATARLFRSLA
jgi:transcriptional regulator with XRE-family HTH domain